MTQGLTLKTANTILYCQKWAETVGFYQQQLGLPVLFATDWFVEFEITATARLSVADERHSRLKSSRGAGITLTLQVEDVDRAWESLRASGVAVEPVQTHAWGARVFYFYDPEGHRLEIWSPQA